MSSDEATINTDGSTTFDGQPPIDNHTNSGGEEFDDTIPPTMDTEEDVLKSVTPAGIDPAVYFLIAVVVISVLYYFFVYRKKSSVNEDSYFSNLDGDKFKLKLPTEVDEYYIIKEKCEAAGWVPGQGLSANTNGPSRVLAQALMKRAVADIPIVTFVQKEAPGMNKLYSQSMCSVNQWRSYQAAETLVSTEVDEVRGEADEIEPGWSQTIWRQAMQYHQVLKQKNEQELKAAEEQAKKRKEIEQKIQAAQAAEQQITAGAGASASPAPAASAVPTAADKSADLEAERIRAAEKAADELIKMEEREMESKKAFAGKGMKKGFLDGNKGKKKK